MNIVTLLLHIGTFSADVADVKALVTDLVGKNTAGVKVDVAKLVADLTALFTAGLIPLPAGVTLEQATQILSGLAAIV
jgi:hypothetical protein